MPRARSLVLDACVDWGSILVDTVMGGVITWTDFGRGNDVTVGRIGNDGSSSRSRTSTSSSSSGRVSEMAVVEFESRFSDRSMWAWGKGRGGDSIAAGPQGFRKLLRGEQGLGGGEEAVSLADIRLLAVPSAAPSTTTLSTAPPSPAETNNPSRPPAPSYKPTPGSPSLKPTPLPTTTRVPTHPTAKPSNEPSYKPSRAPTIHPTWSQVSR